MEVRVQSAIPNVHPTYPLGPLGLVLGNRQAICFLEAHVKQCVGPLVKLYYSPQVIRRHCKDFSCALDAFHKKGDLLFARIVNSKHAINGNLFCPIG